MKIKTIKDKYLITIDDINNIFSGLLAENEKLKQDLCYCKPVKLTVEYKKFEVKNKKLEQELAELQPKPDTPTFYKGQQVLVSNNNSIFESRILVGVSFDCNRPYSVKDDERCERWTYCKPDPNAITRPVWIEYDGGDCPADSTELVAVEFRSGLNDGGLADNIDWKYVIRYCIIPEREAL